MPPTTTGCHHRAARLAGEKLYRSPGLQPVAGYRKTLPPIKLDEKTGYIGVIAYFSDDRATEWKQIESVESIGHHYRLLVHIRASAIEMKKEEN